MPLAALGDDISNFFGAVGDFFGRLAEIQLGPLLLAGIDEARQRAMHALIADALEPCDDPVLVPRHLMFAGREHEALERLRPLRTDARAGFSASTLALLERAVPLAERLSLPPSTRSELQVWLVDNAANLGDYARFMQYAPPLLALGLAPHLVQELMEQLGRLRAEFGISILLIEQDALSALAIADYGYIMEGGRIVYDGTPDRLRNHKDVQEFYLGSGESGRVSYRDVKQYRRSRRWWG